MSLAACAIAALCWSASDEPRKDGANATREPLLFVSLDENLETGNIQVADGIAVDIDDWKSIAISTVANETCTATLIGRQAILTSGHCVDARPWSNNAVVATGKIRFGGEEIDMRECEMHPAYRKAKQFLPFPRVPQDYALCTLKKPVRSQVQPEVLSDKPLTATEPIMLMGFGCSDIKYVEGKWIVVDDPEGTIVLRIGDETISRVGVAVDQGRPEDYALSESDGSTPSICPQDSGGPVWSDVTAEAPDLPRRVSGVNSAFRMTLEGSPARIRILSFLSPIDSAFRFWAEDWGHRHDVEICGIHLPAGLGGCRE